MKNKKSQIKFLLKISICLALLLMIFLLTQGKIPKDSFVSLANDNTQKEYDYLSDIPYVKPQSSTAWGNITMNQASNGNLISVKIEGAFYEFEKGIWAHATSTLVYDLSDYNQYDYFTAYMGLNQTAATSSNGVKFYIYTSKDGKNWDLKTDHEPVVVKAGDNAIFVKIDIKDAKYLKLYANDNGSNGNDHVVYADAKLIKSTYVESIEQSIPNINQLDEKIKTQFANADLANEEYELLLLQRELINKAGSYALTKFLSEDESHKEVFTWLMNDVENLRLYMIGGTPDGGSYYKSLNVLNDLYQKYKNDFEITDTTKYGTVLGDLYKKMAITLSLTHSTNVALWMQPDVPENQSDAITRYQIYKDLHKNNKFVVSSRQDHTKWFEDLTIEEMRYVFNNIIDDEEILWLNEYTQKYIDANPGQEETYLQPHRYMKYIWPNYTKEEYHDEANKEMWSKKYGNFLDYGVTFKPGIFKLWMNLDNGAVCGGISKIGSNIRGVHGTPSSVISQPGHAALIYYRKDAQNKGYWTIDNDVSGWAQSGKTERLSIRMPLGWGNDSYVDGWAASYIVLAQEALNDFQNYEKAEKMIMLADVYKDNPTKQEEIYRKALEVQPINIDAWYGLIKLYREDSTKTEQEIYNLSKELCEKLKCFPLPMYNLSNLMKEKLTSDIYSFKFTILQTRILTEGKTLPDNTEDTYYVYQPAITRTVANYLLGEIDSKLASFSFDGEQAGKIILSNRYDNSGIHWDYSIDGKQTWKEVTFTADEEHKWNLTQDEINNITSENDIYVHIVGVNYEEENLYKIDIKEATGLLENIYANDLENKLIGENNVIEWKYKEKDQWTSYNKEQPNLTGDKTVIVRIGATDVYLPSKETKTCHFTQDNQPEQRKYIPISHLSIDNVSSEATAQGRYAKNVIDGNINTSWHSAWNGSDTEKYIVIKIDEPKYLTSLEFIPVEGGNGKIKNAVISVSMDGENWTEVTQTDWDYTNDMKRIDFTATQGQYIKIQGKETQAASSSLSFIAAKMFNLYEDTTKQIELPIQPEEPDNPKISEDISSEKYKIEEKYILRIVPKTTVSQFKQNIKTEQEIVIIDEEGNTLKEDDVIKTDTILKIGNNTQYTLIVTGDIDGDGEITVNDLAKIKLHIIQIETLAENRLKAADVDGDNEVTINDMAQIKLVLIDLMEIK